MTNAPYFKGQHLTTLDFSCIICDDCDTVKNQSNVTIY